MGTRKQRSDCGYQSCVLFSGYSGGSENENRLYNINQMISVSEDAGKTFRTIIPYSGIHPDHHARWIHPVDANFIIDGMMVVLVFRATAVKLAV